MDDNKENEEELRSTKKRRIQSLPFQMSYAYLINGFKSSNQDICKKILWLSIFEDLINENEKTELLEYLIDYLMKQDLNKNYTNSKSVNDMYLDYLKQCHLKMIYSILVKNGKQNRELVNKFLSSQSNLIENLLNYASNNNSFNMLCYFIKNVGLDQNKNRIYQLIHEKLVHSYESLNKNILIDNESLEFLKCNLSLVSQNYVVTDVDLISKLINTLLPKINLIFNSLSSNLNDIETEHYGKNLLCKYFNKSIDFYMKQISDLLMRMIFEINKNDEIKDVEKSGVEAFYLKLTVILHRSIRINARLFKIIIWLEINL